MCRYAMYPYKPHYACFDCRKSFKRRLLSDIKRGGKHRPARCPQCGALMANMGHDFRPPPMKDVRQWHVLRKLYVVGITFHSCGCYGPGYRPRDPVALRAFLQERLAEDTETLRRWVADTGRDPRKRAEAIVYWTARVAKVERALQDQGRTARTA